MRFGRHTALLEERPGLTVYRRQTENSFEPFSTQEHTISTRDGRNARYVFDSLSDLLHMWATDRMIRDFFFIACPYLFQLNTIAYFPLLRNNHSHKAIARIRETTQVLIDIYNYKGRIRVHPIKVQHRYSPAMFSPHNLGVPGHDERGAGCGLRHVSKGIRSLVVELLSAGRIAAIIHIGALEVSIE